MEQEPDKHAWEAWGKENVSWVCRHCGTVYEFYSSSLSVWNGHCKGRAKDRKKMPYDMQTGACTECGSTVHGKNRNQHNNFHANYIHRAEVVNGVAVGAVKWCDVGNHAFKANEPGAQSLNVSQTNSDGGTETVVMDICGSHAFNTGSDTMKRVENAYARELSATPHHNED